MFDPRELSKAIRAKKKKAMKAEPELVHSDAIPDKNPIDLYNVDQAAQMKETIDSPKQIDADETAMNEPYEQKPMSKEPMSSKVMPRDHAKMAYGGMPVPNGDAMTDVMDLERKYVGGSPESNQEEARMFSNKPSVGTGEGQSGVLGAGLEGEENKRIKMRKMRLSSYMDKLPFTA